MVKLELQCVAYSIVSDTRNDEIPVLMEAWKGTLWGSLELSSAFVMAKKKKPDSASLTVAVAVLYQRWNFNFRLSTFPTQQ